MGEIGIEDRVRAVPAGTSADTPTMEHPVLTPRSALPPDQALHVLTTAQHAADEHVAAATREAHRIRQDAHAAAERVARDAQAHAEDLRREAGRTLAEAHAALQQTAADARDQAGEAQRRAEQILAAARAQADRIGQEARQHAENMKVKANRRYEDSVGSLHAQRTELEQRVRALETFDGEHRAKLTAFIEGRLTALWPDQPPAADASGAAGD